ncbi:hypothetical protein DXT96_18915 [Agrobacterium sp. ICMP 6402]|nr:hypothetical protein [Agrobacterium sp. ICMP 6402]
MPDTTGDVASAIPIEIFQLPAAARGQGDDVHSGKTSHSFHCCPAGKNIPPFILLKKLQFCDKKTF